MNREAIYTALFSRLQTAYAWNTAGRVLMDYDEVPYIQQPAMFMTQVGESATAVTRQKLRWTLHVRVYLYCHSNTQNGVPPATLLNALLDAVTNAIKPDNAVLETQTLGGLVEYARIDGNIETDEGFLGEQAVAVVPITILTAD